MAKANCDDCLNKISNPYHKDPSEKHEADFLCYDCGKYLCFNCFTNHAEHLTLSATDKSDKSKVHQFGENMMGRFRADLDLTLEKFTQERINLCDKVDVGGQGIQNRWNSVKDICILRESRKWIITDCHTRCIKVFNINNNQMTESVGLFFEPWGITDIPSTVPSQCLIAVSFPNENLINVMDIFSDPAHIISRINVEGKCYDLAYCNNKLITRCKDIRGVKGRHSIYVIGMSGEIISVIDLPKVFDIRGTWFGGNVCMAVYSESETIYVCHDKEPSCVISLSLEGHVLHSLLCTDLKPYNLCVYMMGESSSLIKMSPDLIRMKEIIGKDVTQIYRIKAITCLTETFYCARTDGYVYIIRNE